MNNNVLGVGLILLSIHSFAAEERKGHEDAIARRATGAASSVHTESSAPLSSRTAAINDFIENLLHALKMNPNEYPEGFKLMVSHLFETHRDFTATPKLVERISTLSKLCTQSTFQSDDIYWCLFVIKIISTIGSLPDEEYAEYEKKFESILSVIGAYHYQINSTFSRTTWWWFCMNLLSSAKEIEISKLEGKIVEIETAFPGYLAIHESGGYVSIRSDLLLINALIQYTLKDAEKTSRIIQFIKTHNIHINRGISLAFPLIGFFNSEEGDFDKLLKSAKDRAKTEATMMAPKSEGIIISILGGIPDKNVKDFYGKTRDLIRPFLGNYHQDFLMLPANDRLKVIENSLTLVESGNLNRFHLGVSLIDKRAIIYTIGILDYVPFSDYLKAIPILTRLLSIAPKDVFLSRSLSVNSSVLTLLNLPPEDSELILDTLEKNFTQMDASNFADTLDALLKMTPSNYKKFIEDCETLRKESLGYFPDNLCYELSKMPYEDISPLKKILKSDALEKEELQKILRFGVKYASLMYSLKPLLGGLLLDSDLRPTRDDKLILKELLRLMLFTRLYSGDGILENKRRVLSRKNTPLDKPVTGLVLEPGYKRKFHIYDGEDLRQVYRARTGVHQGTRDRETRKAFDLLLTHQKDDTINVPSLIDDLKSFVHSHASSNENALKALMAGIDSVKEVPGYFHSLLSGKENGLYNEDTTKIHQDKFLLAHLWYYITHLEEKDQEIAKTELISALRRCIEDGEIICNPGKYQHLASSILAGRLPGVTLNDVGAGAGAGGAGAGAGGAGAGAGNNEGRYWVHEWPYFGEDDHRVQDYIRDFEIIEQLFRGFAADWTNRVSHAPQSVKALDLFASAFDHWVNLCYQGFFIDPRDVVFYLVFGTGTTGITDLDPTTGLAGMMQEAHPETFDFFDVKSYGHIFNEQEKAIALELREQREMAKETERARLKKIADDRKLREEQDKAFEAAKAIDEAKQRTIEEAAKAAEAKRKEEEEAAAKKDERQPENPAARRALIEAAAAKRAAAARAANTGNTGAGAGSAGH